MGPFWENRFLFFGLDLFFVENAPPPTHTSLRLQMCDTFKVIVLITAGWSDTARWPWDMRERLT